MAWGGRWRDGVDGGGVLRWGVELAAAFSGEVRGAAAPLHKNEKWRCHGGAPWQGDAREGNESG